MSPKWRPKFDEIEVDEALTLVVAWRRGKRLEGAMVPLAGDVVEELREACRETVTRLQQLQVVDYSADALVETGEYMAVPLRIVQE